MHRLRLKFGRGEEIKFISHLDVMRVWERAFRRAQIPLAYSEGFSRHPRISLAAPLAVGITSEAELMDTFLTRLVSPHWFTASLNTQLMRGISMLGVFPIALNMPSLQSQVRYAEYRIEVGGEDGPEDVESAISGLLSAQHLPWKHFRDTGVRNYDLRSLVDDLWLIERHNSGCAIGMRLRCDNAGSGRPEQVALALGFAHHPHSLHRTRLILQTRP
jgi:radical SAM-linked protein